MGTIDQADATTDVVNAKAVGFDAFALNTHTIDPSQVWNTEALGYLFDAADAHDFKLFMSFDMSWNEIQPSAIPSWISTYISRPSYYRVDGRPFISTYQGGTLNNSDWDLGMRQPMAAAGNNPYFVPDFDNWPGYPKGFFSNYTTVDGAYSWETAWPSPGNTVSNVTDSVDSAVLEEAHAAGKIYMMRKLSLISPRCTWRFKLTWRTAWSSFQFKYMDSSDQWYRIGEINMPQRMEQILQLQPDLVELITWNDAGESHYVGNFFESQISGTNIADYADNFDHTGWQQLITPFIWAYKHGATDVSQLWAGSSPVGTLWYRTLLTNASCSPTIQNYQQGQDTVNFAVILPSSGYIIQVYSNNDLIGSFKGKAGLNYNAVPGLQLGGGQRLVVQNSAGTLVAQATGTKDVLAQSPNATCNWNYEVVGLSSPARWNCF